MAEKLRHVLGNPLSKESGGGGADGTDKEFGNEGLESLSEEQGPEGGGGGTVDFIPSPDWRGGGGGGGGPAPIDWFSSNGGVGSGGAIGGGGSRGGPASTS